MTKDLVFLVPARDLHFVCHSTGGLDVRMLLSLGSRRHCDLARGDIGRLPTWPLRHTRRSLSVNRDAPASESV